MFVVSDKIWGFLSLFLIVLIFFFFWGVQVGLELTILLPQPLECWDYRCVPPRLEVQVWVFTWKLEL
jgi:hypothetical protein